MTIPTKKLKSGLELSVLGFGTWFMGGSFTKIEGYDPSLDIAALRRTLELGGRRFDTAEMYAQGYSEEILAEALSGFDRHQLFLTSKVNPEHLSYNDMIAACRRSLKRLKTDYLDLYLVHMPNLAIPIAETMRVFDDLKSEGLVRNIGVCNFNVERLKEAQSFTKNRIVLNQVHYNLLFREPVLKGVLQYCRENDIFLEAWRPLQQGNLAKSGIEIVDRLGEKYKKTPVQIALNWLIAQAGVVTLVKASDQKHLEEAFGALDWQLSAEDVELLSRDYPIQLDRSNAVQLK